MQTKLLINGQLVAGAGAVLDVINPATATSIVKMGEASPDQVNQAVEAARAAYKTWGLTTPQERSLLLLKLADRIEQNAETFAALESLNCGKPKARALADEMPAIVDCFRYFAGAARCLHGSATDEYLTGRLYQHDPARSGRRGGPDHALELPPDDGSVEARACAGGRQYRGHEAFRTDAAYDAEAG